MRRVMFAGCVGAALAALAAGAVVASTGVRQAEIRACVEARTGYLYLAPGGRPCPGDSIAWNQQGPAGPPGPSGGSDGTTEWKVVSKTFESKPYTGEKYAGKWWFSDTPLVTLTCPSGWTAVSSSHNVRSLYYVNAPAGAAKTIDQPIVTADGRLLGFKLGLSVELHTSPSKTAHLTKRPWLAALHVVCARQT